MKRILTLLVAVTVLLFSGCGERVYTDKDIALYNTSAGEYVYLSDSKSRVVEVLGEPDEQPARPTSKGLIRGKIYLYKDSGVEIVFDEKDTVESLKLSRTNNTTNENIRVANNLSYTSNIQDFMDNYPQARDGGNLGSFKTKIINFNKDGDNLSVVEDGNGSYAVCANYSDENASVTRIVIFK